MPPTDISASLSSPLWIFAYGSLMWNPGFSFCEHTRAFVEGWHRRFCIYSHIYRGTPENPGLVLGLDAGGICEGVAFRIAPEHKEDVLTAVRARELVSNVYHERIALATLEDGRRVPVVLYAADTRHTQYAPPCGIGEQLALIRRACGQSGPNRDYVINTWRHMQELGIEDATLQELAARLEEARTDDQPENGLCA